MNVGVRQLMSLADFLVWEERQELRYEFGGFHPYAMVGGTAAHSTVQRNLVTAVTNQTPRQAMPGPWQRAEDRSGGQYPLSGCLRRLLSGGAQGHGRFRPGGHL